jgi:DNA invertase Pin-like site-specific DNA recombinase
MRSLEDQIALCREAASRFACHVLESHIYTDQEISGAIDQRPSYVQLLQAAKDHVVDAIVVEAQDRLWRDQGEMHHALKRLRFWGVRVFSVTAGTDLTEKTGSLLASVTGWKDEVFLEDLREKTRRGMLGQVRRGLVAGGRSYGYSSEAVRDETGQTAGARRIIDRKEAEVVLRIFTLYDKGMAPKAIAHFLNRERVPPPRPRRGRHPMGWTWTTINGTPKKALGILNNPLYIGRLVWNRSRKVRDPDTGKRLMRMRPPEEWITTETPELRIVPQSLWDRVQQRRAGRRGLTVHSDLRGKRPKYLFSGLLVCGTCGAAYTIDSGKYYGCATHRNRGPIVCQNNRQVHRVRLEEALLQLVFHDVFSHEVIRYLTLKVDAALRRLTAAQTSPRHLLQADLAKARAELDNVKQAIL